MKGEMTVSEKRRDSNNRILHTGERQRTDGKYMYCYVGTNGKTQSIFSWRLVCTDPILAGKEDNGTLRDRKNMIHKNLDDSMLSKEALLWFWI